MIELWTCAVCKGDTGIAEPASLVTHDEPPARVRLWLCSPECSLAAGGKLGMQPFKLQKLRELFDAGGVELLGDIVRDLRTLLYHCPICHAVGEPEDNRHKVWCPKVQR